MSARPDHVVLGGENLVEHGLQLDVLRELQTSRRGLLFEVGYAPLDAAMSPVGFPRVWIPLYSDLMESVHVLL